jgi:hypothetical protein
LICGFGPEKWLRSGIVVSDEGGDAATAIADSLADKQSLKDALHTGVDTALDPTTRAQAVKGVARGVHQGLSGFNEGIGNVVFAPADAPDSGTDYIAGKLAAAFGAGAAYAVAESSRLLQSSIR